MTTTLPAKMPDSASVSASPRVPWGVPSTITPQLVAWAVALGVAYWLLTKVVVYDVFGLNEDSAGVVFFPAAGLGIAAMMLTRPRVWWLWAAAIAIAELAINLQAGDALILHERPNPDFPFTRLVEIIYRKRATREEIHRMADMPGLASQWRDQARAWLG